MDDILIGKSAVSKMMPHMIQIARLYNLKLNRAKDFKLARTILVNLYTENWFNGSYFIHICWCFGSNSFV